jgi:hypothetical protein
MFSKNQIRAAALISTKEELERSKERQRVLEAELERTKEELERSKERERAATAELERERAATNHRRPPPALGVLGLAAGRTKEELERSKERERARCFGGTEGAQQAAGLRPEDDEVSPLKDENHGVQYYLSVIESPAMDSKKTELITAMLRLETRPHVLKVFSETAMWRGQGEQGYFHGAPEDWNFVAAALREAPPGDDDAVEEHGEAAAELERERAATAELRRTEVRLVAEH